MREPLVHFVHISDTHIHYDPAYGVSETGRSPLRNAQVLVEELNRLPFDPAFVLHTGDVAADPIAGVYEPVREIFGRLRHPIYYLAGNHDVFEEVLELAMPPRAHHSRTLYEFEANGVQFVCVDTNAPAPPFCGAAHADDLPRLEAICAARDDRPLVIATHHNVLEVSIEWLDQSMRMINGEDFHRAILPARHRIRGVFFGHVHQDIEMVRDGILYSSVASTWYQLHAWPGEIPTARDPASPPGFNVVTIWPNQTFIRRHSLAV